MTDLPPFGLGHPRTELRRLLATAGLFEEYEAEGFEGEVGRGTQIVAIRFRVVEEVE